MRFMGLLRADADSEGGCAPSPDLMARMGTFIEEITKAGVMLATDGLHPSSKGARVKLADGQFTVRDGPFTESKELVASYAVFEVKSKQEAIDWTKRFLQVLGRGECEIRQIFEPSDFSPEAFPPAQAEKESRLREEMQGRAARR